MTENIENIVLEHLCYIRRSMDELRLDIADLKTRVTAIEITNATAAMNFIVATLASAAE